jgi:UDP:flavonoid glycosyltransferase YjiC (YdhE family)
MDALLATLASYGNVFPTVGIGARLAQTGHAVTLLSNAQFQTLAGEHGPDFVALGNEAEFRQFADHPDPFDPGKSFALFMNTVTLGSGVGQCLSADHSRHRCEV